MNTRSNAFTLIELLMGMTIMAMVIGSVFMTIHVGMAAYNQGQHSMELYQSARMALQKISDEMRFSLSPHAFWRPGDTYTEMGEDLLMQKMRGMPIREKDPGAIIFKGSSSRVQYVRKVYQLDQFPPFDLQECEIFADEETNRLLLNVRRSLLAVKRKSWMFMHLFEVNLSGIVLAQGVHGERYRSRGMLNEPPLDDFIGDYGTINRLYVIAEGIQKVSFRFGDDSGLKKNWDSQVLIKEYRKSRDSPNFNPTQDTEIYEKGPPLIVEISLQLENGDTLMTATDVPAGNMRGKITPGQGGAPPAAPPGPAKAPKTETQAAVPVPRG